MASHRPFADPTGQSLLPRRVWQLRRHALPPVGAWLLSAVRIALLAAHRFQLNRLALQASALSLYAMLALVPAVAVALAIAKGFGLQELLENELLRLFHGQDQTATWVIGAARSFLSGTKSSLLAAAGGLMLLWSVGRMLGHIEACFNAIWEVSGTRRLERRLGNYLLLLFSGPLLLVASGSAALFVAGNVVSALRHYTWLKAASPLLLSLLDLGPLLLTAAFLSLLYLLLPNIRVRPLSALIAAALAAAAHQSAQRLLVAFQIGATQASALYGSLAALPLFLIWLQMSWWIVLLGAELAYAHEYACEWEGLPDWRDSGAAGRRVAALAICRLIGERFATARPPLDLCQIAKAIDIPQRLARELLGALVASGLLQLVCPESGRAPAYLPARSLDGLRIADVLQALEAGDVSQPALEPVSNQLPACSQALAELHRALHTAPANRRLLEIGAGDVAAPAAEPSAP